MSSLEDHGYLVDIGVSGARAFLPLQKAQEYIQQKNKGERKKRDQSMVVRWYMGGLYLNATLLSKMQNADPEACLALLKSTVNLK